MCVIGAQSTKYENVTMGDIFDAVEGLGLSENRILDVVNRLHDCGIRTQRLKKE